MEWGWRWTLFILIVGAADFAVRLITGFNMVWVVRAEAALFFGASVTLWVFHRGKPAQVRWQLWLQRVLVALFALAGLRAALWALGLPVARANVIALIVAVVLGGVTLRRPRHSRRHRQRG